MKILSLHVENFGKLSHFSIDFEKKENTILAPNGWGKSTMAGFIKAMLYGLPSSTKRDLRENDRKRYTPWQGGVWGGSLTFSVGKKSYRVERFFRDGADTFALFDLATHLKSDDFSENLGQELFGIDAQGFERTTFLSGSHSAIGTAGSDLVGKMNHLLDATDDIGRYDDAMATLVERQVFYKAKKGNNGKLKELENAIKLAEEDIESCLRQKKGATERRLVVAQKTEKRLELEGEIIRTNALLSKYKDAKSREALFEQYKEAKALAIAKRKEAGTLLTEFGGSMPTAETIKTMRQNEQALKSAERRLEEEKLTAFEEERLLYLDKHFAQKLPSTEELERWETQTSEVTHLLKSAKDSRPTEEFLHLDETMAEVPDALELAEGKVAEELLNGKKKFEQFRLFLVAFAGVFLVTGTILAFVILPLAMVFFALSALSIAGYLATNRKAKYQKAQAILETLAELCAVDKSATLKTIESRIQMYNVLYEQERRRIEECRTASEKAKALAEDISKELAVYHYEGEDVRESLRSLRENLAEYTPLCERRQQVSTQQAFIKKEIQRHNFVLKAFFAPCRFKEQEGAENENGEEVENAATRREAYERAEAIAEQKEKEAEALKERYRLDEETMGSTITEEDIGALHEKIEELDASERLLHKEISDLSREADRLESLADTETETRERLDAMRETLAEYRRNYQTILLTIQYLEQAKNNLSSRYIGAMEKSFTTYLSEISDHSGIEAELDAKFSVRLLAHGSGREVASFSQGWQDMIEFCLRLSLVDALFEEEKPFLILDDPFVNLDEENLARAHALLSRSAKKYQILHLICRSTDGSDENQTKHVFEREVFDTKGEKNSAWRTVKTETTPKKKTTRKKKAVSASEEVANAENAATLDGTNSDGEVTAQTTAEPEVTVEETLDKTETADKTEKRKTTKSTTKKKKDIQKKQEVTQISLEEIL